MSDKKPSRPKAKPKRMNPTASCERTVADHDGGLYSVVVYTDGESYNSFVYHASDVASRSVPNVETKLLDIPVQLTDLWRAPAGRIHVADADGNVHQYDGKRWTVKQVSPRALTVIWGRADGELYAAGDEGVIYRGDGKTWAPLGAALGETIFSVRGAGEGGVYACGANGLFGHHDGKTWTPIALPGKRRLHSLLVRSATEVLVCGTGGLLFRGAGTNWADLSQPDHDLHAIESYGGTLFVAAGGKGLFTFDDTSLTSIKPWPCYRLSANAEYLAAAGDNLAARFDGSAWFGSRFT